MTGRAGSQVFNEPLVITYPPLRTEQRTYEVPVTGPKPQELASHPSPTGMDIVELRPDTESILDGDMALIEDTACC